jgi:hypothetical protein
VAFSGQKVKRGKNATSLCPDGDSLVSQMNLQADPAVGSQMRLAGAQGAGVGIAGDANDAVCG